MGSFVVKAMVDADLVQRLSHCADFNVEGLRDVLVTRRGLTIPIQLRTSKETRLGCVDSTTLVYAYDASKQVALEIVSFEIRGYGAELQVKIPANTPVTIYVLSIKGSFENGEKYKVALEQDVFILFNAWSKDDQVYLEDESQRQEYVLNSKGRLYLGDLRGNTWNLALYHPNTFHAVHFICEKLSKLSFEQKADAVLVAREITALINVEDDNGVIVGRCDGEYSDGKKPSSWTGSGAILEQFYESGGEPVKYGNCWVFSGVLLTVLRVLGLPSRSVTNFSSSRDSQGKRVINRYYASEGEAIDFLSSGYDCIWKFHVWNETWMLRPDLCAGYGGWQALDSTPQEETSQGGGYKAGPSSLKAIKNGNNLNYDTTFFIAEVNAEIKTFVLNADGVPQLYSIHTNTVGKTIYTKSVGSLKREDITHLYKYPKGSCREQGKLYHNYQDLKDEVHDVEFTVMEADYEFGSDMVFKVKAFNKGKKKTIQGTIICQAVTYTGRVLGDVRSLSVGVDVNQGKESTVEMMVQSEALTKFSGTKVFLKFMVTLTVVGTTQHFYKTVLLTAQCPNLSISGKDQIAIGERTKLLFSFKNPLPVEMKDVTLNIDVEGMKEGDVVQSIGTIRPYRQMNYVLEITGVKLGKFNIVATLTSNKVEQVSGEYEIEVLKSVSPKRIVELDTLEIKEVDLNKSTNNSAHHTESYEYSGLVVRRGQSFSITLTTTRPLPTGSEVVTTASFQMVSKYPGQQISFELNTISSSVQGNAITLELKPPADTCIGEYTLVLTVDNNGVVNVLHKEIRVVILFNPWSKDDSCHYPTASDLDEYVLNTRGRIWVGNVNSNYGRPWQFSQFNKDSLEVALWIMDHIMIAKERGNPVLVSRHISAMTNVQDNNGILVGNWSMDYSGGTQPDKWTGSGAILTQFNKTKSPVSFAQCWVYSGILTTLLRCLGLPARSITNFNSAHHTDANSAIDRFYDENGNLKTSDDSIWIFHAWNEGWMARPDLPAGFGGWQVLDSTPQEQRDGGYLLGPASCRAIKLRQTMKYNVEFVINEVNADVRSYTLHKDGSQTLFGVNTSHVGKSISTKAIGINRREDITSNYKFEEGSSAERAALLVETESERLIYVSIEVDHNVQVGDDFTVKTAVTNKAPSLRTFKVQQYVCTVLYTGIHGEMVKQTCVTVEFRAGEKKEYELHIMYKDYLCILQGGNFINIVCMVYDQENQKSVIQHENLRLKTPDITIELPKEGLKMYQESVIKVSFKNPLQIILTDGKFELHGDGYIQDTTKEILKVFPWQIIMATLKTIPVKPGNFQLQVVFSSAQLTEVMGDEDVTVTVA